MLRAGESGEGKVVEDNTSMIQSSLEDYGGSVPTPPRRVSSSGGCGFVGSAPAGGLALVTLGLAALLGRKRRCRAE